MLIKLDNVSHNYDREMFGKRLTSLRKDRWKQYKLNQNIKNNPYEKFVYCASQDSLATKLGVERRTLGRWELGTSFPPLDKAIELCKLLDCSLDYLLGADNLEGFFRPTLIASHYSGISEDIITYASENNDYQDCLNFFMHPLKCSKLFNQITLNAWRDYFYAYEFDLITDPLKSRIEDIFYQYQVFTPISKYGLDSYKQFVMDSIPADSITFSSRKSDDRLYVNPCIPISVLEKLSLKSKNRDSYDSFIDYIVNCSFDALNTRALLDVRKDELGKLFVQLFEEYLTTDEFPRFKKETD